MAKILIRKAQNVNSTINQTNIKKLYANTNHPSFARQVGCDKDIDNFALKYYKDFKVGSKVDTLKFQFDNAAIKNLDNQNVKFLKQIHKNCKCNIEIGDIYKTNTPLIVGKGEKSQFEQGITLHHIYGIPYIPSSGFHGAVRNYVIVYKFNQNENDALANPMFKAIFGDTENEGLVFFYDAFPTSSPTFKIDIDNVHFKKYYNSEGDKAPTDRDDPSLLLFPTVNGSFRFNFGILELSKLKERVSFIALKTDDKNKTDEIVVEKIYEKTKEWIHETLTIGGIGAKTGVGYGLFSK